MMISPQRQSELRLLHIDDIASDRSTIIFNKFSTKTLTPARIPLSRQGRKIIELALKLSGGKYIFSTSDKPISDYKEWANYFFKKKKQNNSFFRYAQKAQYECVLRYA